MYHTEEFIHDKLGTYYLDVGTGEHAAKNHGRVKNTDPLAFPELLMTFSFEFQSVSEFCGFAAKLIYAALDKIKAKYLFDCAYIDQFSISPDNRIVMQDPGDLVYIYKHLQAPENYFNMNYDLNAAARHNKKLSYCLGLILVEIISQRQLARVPENTSPDRYSMFIHRHGKLNKFIQILSHGAFTQKLFYLQEHGYSKHSIDYYARTLYLISVLQQMVSYTPTQRLSLQDSLFYLGELSTSFNIRYVRNNNINKDQIIRQQIKYDQKVAFNIVKNLIKSIEQENQGQKNFITEDIAKIKKIFCSSSNNLTDGIEAMLQLLNKSYNMEHDYKYFAYLQQFYVKFYYELRSFVADNIYTAMEAKYIDTEEYFHVSNVFQYFSKLDMFSKIDDTYVYV